MKLTHARNLTYALALSCLFAAGTAHAQALPPVPPAEVKASTEPSKRAQMNFREIGLVAKVEVKEGQVVKAGDMLMVLDTVIDELELKRLKDEYDDSSRLDFAKVDRDVKKNQYERIKEKIGGFSPFEVEQAKLDWDRAEAQIKVVMLEQRSNGLRVDQQKAKIDRMTLKAEFDGVVESIKIREGELSSVDTDKPAIVVVQKTPARVVITTLRTDQVAKLDLGESLEVKYADQTEWREAKVTFKAPVADARSNYQIVWLELPNPEQRDLGLPVQVKLPAKLLTPAAPAAQVAIPNR